MSEHAFVALGYVALAGFVVWLCFSKGRIG